MLCRDHKEGGFGTQKDRSNILQLAGRQLREAGFRGMTPESLKPKHVNHLVNRWKEEKLSPGAIKNRMSALRWWAAKVGKPAIIPRTNAELGIEERTRIATESKAKPLSDDLLGKVGNRYVEASLRLQEAFGLRREESIKIQPQMALRGAVLSLKGSWCKGGRPRSIEVRTDKQREALAFAQAVAKGGALIPHDKNYIEQLNVFKHVTSQANIDNVHGFRHYYAQQRYEELTGNKAPVEGGLSRSEMSPEQKQVDDSARMHISQELGHGRLDVVSSYLGR